MLLYILPQPQMCSPCHLCFTSHMCAIGQTAHYKCERLSLKSTPANLAKGHRAAVVYSCMNELEDREQLQQFTLYVTRQTQCRFQDSTTVCAAQNRLSRLMIQLQWTVVTTEDPKVMALIMKNVGVSVTLCWVHMTFNVSHNQVWKDFALQYNNHLLLYIILPSAHVYSNLYSLFLFIFPFLSV